MISLYGEFVLANLCISGPERDFIYYDSFWSYNCQWLDLMNQTSCVGKKYQNRGRCIGYSISDSQYKSG